MQGTQYVSYRAVSSACKVIPLDFVPSAYSLYSCGYVSQGVQIVVWLCLGGSPRLNPMRLHIWPPTIEGDILFVYDNGGASVLVYNY